MSPSIPANRKAFLDMLAHSEGTSKIGKNDGYDVIVGSKPNNIIRIDDLSEHPRVTVQVQAGLWSSAAGRYQFIWPTWRGLMAKMHLPDFGRDSQDRAALALIDEHGALQMIDKGEIADAINACAPVWASLPGAGYGQNEHSLSALIAVYQLKGGHLA